jgi:cell division protein FtsB
MLMADVNEIAQLTHENISLKAEVALLNNCCL